MFFGSDGEVWFLQSVSVMESPYPTPISPTRTRVGWIGIGVMGGAMASRLRAAGYALTIYSRTPSKALHLQTLGAQLAASPAAVARASDVVFTMVGHPSDVRSVVLGDDGILSGLSPGSVTVDCTSSHPDLARSIAAAAAERGCWAVDAPVSGGDIGAREGKLAILAGGDVGVVRWLTPLFEAMGKATYMGPAGSGQSCKIANQIAVGGSILGLSEGLVFAEKAGLDLRSFVGAVGGGAAGSKVMELFGERMIERDFRPGGFAEYMVKDLGMGLEGGGGDDEKGKVVLPGAALCKQLYLGMVANGNGKMGTQGLITVIEKINAMACLSLARRKLKLKKLAIAVQWWLNILYLVGLFIQLSYKLFERQCMGGSTHNMDGFREVALIIGNKIVKATKKFSRAIGVDLDIANKRDKINEELRKLPNLSRAERHKALIAIGRDHEMTALLFTLENDEKEDFVRALLSGGL